MAKKPLKELHRQRYPVDAIIRAYASGKSALDTGLEFGINAGTIQIILKTAGVKLRESYSSMHKRILELTDKIISMYVDDELNISEIGDILGFSKTSIRNVLVMNDVPRRMPGKSKKLHVQPGRYREKGYDVDAIVAAYTEEGLGLRKVGWRFGVSGQLVKDILKSEGVPRRTPAEAAKLRWETDPPQNIGRKKCDQLHKPVTDEHDSSLQHLAIKELRNEHNLKIDEIADVKGISRLAVSQELGLL